MKRQLCLSLLFTLISSVASAALMNPWADNVISYFPGHNPGPVAGHTDPFNALGAPTRSTNPASPWGGPVTPGSPAWGPNELVSLGAGGSLTLSFDEPITDDPDNPYGIDLLVFGNSYYIGAYNANPATGAHTEGGVIEVSQDGLTYFTVTGAADGPFPTNGYTDAGATIPTDFTKPVNPAFDGSGHTISEIIAGYKGSGGGFGVDIAPTGLSEISYIRFSNPLGATVTPEIDAVADVASVPEPTSLVLFIFAGISLTALRKRM